MKKKNVLVVYGGTSKEREVSLNSGKACYKAIKKLGYKVSYFDPAKKLLNEIKSLGNEIIDLKKNK